MRWPPPASILTSSPFVGQGDIFITPTGDDTTYANGPEILSPQGNVVWFHPISQGQTASDFRAQTYDGQPVLTWWQGTGLGGLSSGTDYIYNDRYQQVAQVNAGDGLSADGHEFLITPWNTALILAYTTATANLTSIGGPADQTVINGVVQEIDIATGQVLFQWNSADHVPYSQSEQLGNGLYTFFDNESSGTPLLPYSRAVTVRLNFWDHVATLVSSDDQPEGLSAASQGNAQTTAQGNLFVGWGALPYFSELSPSGQLLFNAQFPAGVNTYRAYLLPWSPPGSGFPGPSVPGPSHPQPPRGLRGRGR